MDRIESLEVFVQVAETASFSAVARARRLSPTMVAKHVRAIEDRLGLKLIQRTTRRQSLTDAGRRYLEQARQLLSGWQEAEASVLSLQTAPRGTLRISCPVTFGTERLAPSLAGYLHANPEVQVELLLSDRAPSLPEDGIDAAFWIGELHDSELIARPLLPYRMRLCAAPTYLKRHGTPKKPDDLKTHNCLGFAHWDRKDRWTLKGVRGTLTVPVSGSLTASNGQALRQAALAGIGIVLQPDALLSTDIKQGLLIPLLPSYEPAQRPMHLLYAADRQPTPKLRSFIDFAVDQFGRA